VLVEGWHGYYYETLLDYIHLNPARAKLVRPRRGQSLLDYKWSSVAGGYALAARKRAKWLAAEEGLAAFGCKDTTCSHLRRGWYWGSQAFGEKMLKLAGVILGRDRSRIYRASLERRAHDVAKAEQLLREGLQAAGLDWRNLQRLSGSDARKVAIARAIWEQTVLPQTWLAERLRMRSAANVSQQLRRHRAHAKRSELPLSLQKWSSSVKI
jgi:hypothetical protein